MQEWEHACSTSYAQLDVHTMEAIANIWYRCPGVNNAGSERGHRDGGRSCKADVMKGLESDLCHCKYPCPLLTLDNTPSDKLLVSPNDGSSEQIAAFQISIRHGRLCLVIEERVAITGHSGCATISRISNWRASIRVRLGERCRWDTISIRENYIPIFSQI